MSFALPSYSIVSPVMNEREWLPQTIACIVSQAHRPRQWVIVDDGSSDGTDSIALEAARQYSWITVMRSVGTGSRRARGAPIVAAFRQGLQGIGGRDEFVVKLDGDLYVPSHYFEWVARIFEHVAAAGIVGGRAWVHRSGMWREDEVARHTVAGVCKAYRRTCLSDIGGLHASMG